MRTYVSLLFLLLSILSVYCSQEEADIFSEIIKYLKEDGTCEENKIMKEIHQFAECMKKQHSDTFDHLKSHSENKDAVKAVCKTDLSNCSIKLGNSIKECVHEKKYREFFVNQINFLSGAQKYACSDNGKPLSEFLNTGLKCFNSKEIEQILAKNCSQEIQQTFAGLSTKFDIDTVCRGLSVTGKCLINTADMCDDKTAKNYVQHIFVAALKDTDCRDEFQEYIPDSAITISGSNFLFVAIAVLQFKLF